MAAISFITLAWLADLVPVLALGWLVGEAPLRVILALGVGLAEKGTRHCVVGQPWGLGRSRETLVAGKSSRAGVLELLGK